MDHGYAATLPFNPLPPEVTSTGARIVTFLHAGGRSVVLVGNRGSGKTATLDAVLAGMPAWVERVANRIPQPLTLARILAQIGARGSESEGWAGAPSQQIWMPEAAAAADRDDAGIVEGGAELLRTMAERSGLSQCAVLAVDDAHTLTPEALAALTLVPGFGGPDLPGMVLLLAGEPSLLGLLHGQGLSRLRGAGTLTLRMPEGPGATENSPLDTGASKPALGQPKSVAPPDEAEPLCRWPYVAAALGTTLLATALMLRPGGLPQLPTDAPRTWEQARVSAAPAQPASAMPPAPLSIAPLPAPAQPEPAEMPAGPAARLTTTPSPAVPAEPSVSEPRFGSGAAAPSNAEPPLPPPAEPEQPQRAETDPPRAAPPSPRPGPSEAQLRHDFDVFLNRAGRDTAQLTPAARVTLFREYMQWRVRPGMERSSAERPVERPMP